MKNTAEIMTDSTVYIGDNPPHITKINVHIYDEATYTCITYFDEHIIKEALAVGKHVWLDIYGLASTKQISHCCALFEIHPLIIEDIMHTHQRPKIDLIKDGMFIVFKILDHLTHDFDYHSEQFSMILKENLLFTFRESEDKRLTSLYERLAADHSLVREHGIDYLIYLIMDTVVDDFFHIIEKIDQPLDAMEDLLVKNPQSIALNEVYTIKRRTMILRKTIAPLRDIMHVLISEHSRFIKDEYHIYFRDLHDHCLRLLEAIDIQREMTNNLLDIYLSTLNNRMNETMKILTLFASIFIPLTFIAGVYGMNFEFMPELKWRYGYPVVMTGMILVAVVMLYYFKKKKLL